MQAYQAVLYHTLAPPRPPNAHHPNAPQSASLTAALVDAERVAPEVKVLGPGPGPWVRPLTGS